QRHTPYYMVVALQRPLGSSGVTIPNYQWIAEAERQTLARKTELREILRIDDLPWDLSVSVYHDAEGLP
ncbi:MAG: hypothetical protein VX252_16315, partial [Myxococcota bacterium]|nr:hypothetical protein [Myxococcota bacterium]